MNLVGKFYCPQPPFSAFALNWNWKKIFICCILWGGYSAASHPEVEKSVTTVDLGDLDYSLRSIFLGQSKTRKITTLNHLLLLLIHLRWNTYDLGLYGNFGQSPGLSTHKYVESNGYGKPGSDIASLVYWTLLYKRDVLGCKSFKIEKTLKKRKTTRICKNKEEEKSHEFHDVWRKPKYKIKNSGECDSCLWNIFSLHGMISKN